MNLKDKLRQLDRSTGGRDAAAPPRRAPNEDALASQLNGEWIETNAGRFLRVRHRYPWPHPHGAMLLRPAHEIDRENLRVMAKNSISEQFDPQLALFFDTETTGLAGGTGTYVFLIGLGYCTEEAFVVEQLFLSELNGERAMLAYFDSLLQQRRGLVSFNGKSFDAPLLSTRFIQQRMSPTLDLHEHLDLLHAARRLVKNDYGDCSLSTLERSLLGLERHGDVPGEEIPAIYMDFLRTGNADALPPIFYHNRMDILSLYALLMHLAERVQLARDAGIAPEQAARVARLHVQVRAPETAATIYRNLLEKHEIDPANEVEFLLNFARSKKQLRQYDEAVQAWLRIVEQKRFVLEPFVELAKYYEHRQRDYERALTYTRRALNAIQMRLQLMPDGQLHRARQDLLHRQERLLRKLKKYKR